MAHRYLIALGSNRRHHRHGRPEGVLAAARAALNGKKLCVKAASAVLSSAALGPSRRRFANAAALVCARLAPDELLVRLKDIERAFGRRRSQRWGARVLDLDIILWSGGAWASPGLIVPHVAFRERMFVLRPISGLAPSWRDPVTGLNLRQLHARLTRRNALPIRHTQSGP